MPGKIVKYILVLMSAFFVTSMLIFLYVAKWSPGARLALTNVENSKRLEIGMPGEQVVGIMGVPEKKYTNSNSDSVYFYVPPFAASNGIDVVLDKEGKVTKIHYFE